MVISAAFTVNGVANPAAHAVAYGATVTLQLTSLSGLNSVTWEILGKSHSSMTAPTLTPSGSLGSTCTFSQVADPSDGLGRAVLVRCSVTDASGNIARQSAIVGTVNVNNLVPGVVGETTERDGTSGWAVLVNAGIALPRERMLRGTDLTNANATIQVSQGNRRVMPAATLTANRVVTLSATGATAGEIISIERQGTEAFTLTIDNHDAADLYVFPVSVRRAADFRFDGVDWVLSGHSALTLQV